MLAALSRCLRFRAQAITVLLKQTEGARDVIDALAPELATAPHPQGPSRRLALLLGFLARAEVEAILSQTPIRLAGDLTISQALSAANAARNVVRRYTPKPATLVGSGGCPRVRGS